MTNKKYLFLCFSVNIICAIDCNEFNKCTEYRFYITKYRFWRSKQILLEVCPCEPLMVLEKDWTLWNRLPLNPKGMSVSYGRKNIICGRIPFELTAIFTVIIHIPYVTIFPVDYSLLIISIWCFYFIGLRVICSFSPFQLLFSFFNIFWLSSPHKLSF